MYIPKRAFRLQSPIDPSNLEDSQLKCVINQQIIQPLFSSGVILTEYGNCTGQGSLNKIKNLTEWSSIEKVRKAYNVLPEAFFSRAQKRGGLKRVSSYGLKHTVEDLVGEHIANGECIVAVILRGCSADFGQGHEYGPFVNPILYPNPM